MSSDPRPLAGLRVISFGTFVVGNVCATMLSDLGADVAKVESPRRPEALRSYFSLDHPNIHEPSGVRTTNMFASLTSGQRSISLNMDVESGRELFRRLVAEADVLVENFSPGQMKRWGCGFETLIRQRPGLVMASLTGYGQTGRRASYRAYASNIANYLGLASSWAFDGTHFDFVGAHHAVSAILGAVESVRQGGPAVHIDLAQAETGAAVMAPLYLASVNGGPTWSQAPNVVPGSAMSGVFACLGDDEWVAVDLEDAADARAAHALLELDDADAVDDAATSGLWAALVDWCARLTPYQAVLRLQRAGLAAAVVEDLEDLWRDPQLRSRGCYRDVVHPDIGWRELPASPDQVALGLPRTTRPGARLGADTAAVLRTWLGLSDEDIDQLQESDACWRPPQDDQDAAEPPGENVGPRLVQPLNRAPAGGHD
ncbi:MAG: CaiB/BaiF CoA-transferase family protein [Mycobacterium sp.]